MATTLNNPLRRSPAAPRTEIAKDTIDEGSTQAPQNDISVVTSSSKAIIEAPQSGGVMSEDLKRELDRLGLVVTCPKKTYKKAAYEIEESVHERFHAMYSVLGYKKVKDAMTDAVAQWCENNQAEFLRRNGKK